ncbi:hypothetical protein OsJ_02768 [Oryza sativa Japonica Group]|uniref:Uncharacterized protein n=1 Tax=Oryza sativa subsp. japonica TaxID=39947 RepID=B9EY97_ORYSJ|nr:hypothetical protein OsJ_02768 [Oryza sativa Japonica Group]
MASARPYRFPVPAEGGEPTRRRSAAQSCGTCGASAVASCVALCCCPCAVLQEWRPVGADGAVRAERKQDRREPGRTGGAASAAPPGDASVDAISAVGEGSGRARPRVDTAEKTWVEIYQLGHWGFGRLSFSQPQVIRGDTCGNDGVAASRQ